MIKIYFSFLYLFYFLTLIFWYPLLNVFRSQHITVFCIVCKNGLNYLGTIMQKIITENLHCEKYFLMGFYISMTNFNNNYKFTKMFLHEHGNLLTFFYPFLVEKALFWGQIIETDILMDWNNFRSPESKNYIFSG